MFLRTFYSPLRRGGVSRLGGEGEGLYFFPQFSIVTLSVCIASRQ